VGGQDDLVYGLLSIRKPRVRKMNQKPIIN